MPRRRQAILLGYLTLGAFFVAHSINALVSQALVQPVTGEALSVSAVVPSRASVGSASLAQEIVNSGLFASAHVPGDLGRAIDPSATLKPLDAAKRIKLMGTVVGDGVSALAVLEDVQTKKQVLYHLYDRIPDVGQIVEIRRDGIMVQEGQQREFVELSNGMAQQPGIPSAMPARASKSVPGRAAGNRLILDRRTVAESVADIPKLLSQAQAVPFYAEGKLEGWRIESIRPGSLYEKIGLLAGDVLQQVNGVEIRDPAMMLTLFQQIRNENQVKLDLLRTNQRTTLTYDIR